MTFRPQYRWLLVLTIVAVVLHYFTTFGAITYIPAPLLLALTVTWLVPHLWWLLIFIALWAELFGTTPGGIISVVIAFPGLVYLIRRHTEVDLAFSFIILLAISTAGQLLILLGSDILPVWWQATSGSLIEYIPWHHVALVWVSLTGAAFILSVTIHRLLYAERR